MNNAKNANYLQIDHKVKNIFGLDGVIVLPSRQAWSDFKWTRPYFIKKPKEGYFIWVKKQKDFPLTTCITVASPKISQNLTNLLVVEYKSQSQCSLQCG